MEISEVRVKLIGNSGDRLRAFCSITLDGEFVIRDLKIIDGPTGAFVAMPSRKLSERCPACSHKNHLRARFCNFCGKKLPDLPVRTDRNGRDKLHADIAHPINSACRERIQKRVVDAYQEELRASAQPGYVPKTLDEDFEDEFFADTLEPSREQSPSVDPTDRSHTESSWAAADSRPTRLNDAGHRPHTAPTAESGSPESFGKGIL